MYFAISGLSGSQQTKHLVKPIHSCIVVKQAFTQPY